MISLQDVTKTFLGPNAAEVRAVDQVSLEINEGELVCLLGTSGSGKTTLLKMINRLIEPTSGMIHLDGDGIHDMNVIKLRRKIGYVIQHVGLFPHLSVAHNIGLLCKLEGWSRSAIKDRVWDLMDLVNLAPRDFASRYPDELSGGQQQRVGVARALALDPAYLLMDEPFGALDPITRDQIHQEFLQLRQKVRKTIILVTHDLREASVLGDRIALMDQGMLVQYGTNDELRTDPATPFVRDFFQALPR